MNMENYVPKKEVKPYKEDFAKIMKSIRPTIKQQGITFTYNLVGSAKRNLVIRYPNKGFDCDYQIFIQKNKKNLKPKELKLMFITEINKVLKALFPKYDNCEDKTTAITIKQKNQESSSIEFSFDIVIMKIENNQAKIIRKNDEKNEYNFELLKDMKITQNLIKQIKHQQMWDEVREKYYDEKMKYLDNGNKKSFQILNEVLYGIINRLEN